MFLAFALIGTPANAAVTEVLDAQENHTDFDVLAVYDLAPFSIDPHVCLPLNHDPNDCRKIELGSPQGEDGNLGAFSHGMIDRRTYSWNAPRQLYVEWEMGEGFGSIWAMNSEGQTADAEVFCGGKSCKWRARIKATNSTIVDIRVHAEHYVSFTRIRREG